MTTARQFLCAVFLLFGYSLSGFCDVPDAYLITPNSVGKVKLGMTLAQVRKAVHPLKLKKTEGREGVPAVEVNSGSGTDLLLYFDFGPDGEYKIKESSKVRFIHVLSESYATRQGVHKGMLLSEAEKRMGKLVEFMPPTEGDFGTCIKFEGLPDAYFEVCGEFVYKKYQAFIGYKPTTEICDLYLAL